MVGNIVTYDLCTEKVFASGEGGRDGYEVVWCKPRLEKGKVDGVVQRLNDSRELGGLLKGMRAAFSEEMK